MAIQDNLSGPIGEVRTASTAGGGTALTTTAAFIAFPARTNYIILTPRNFSTAVVVKYALNPYLIVLKTTDALAATANLTGGSGATSENMQDGDTATTLTLNSFNTAANNNFLYVGSHIQFRGVRVLVGNTNSNAAVLTVKYWNGSAWTDITATDGTAVAGASFGQDGNVTWTVPTSWVPAPLNNAFGTPTIPGTGDTTLTGPAFLINPQVYWTRWETSLQFDATVTATAMLAMNRNTAQYDEMVSGSSREQRIFKGFYGIGCIEALTDAGTANLIVSAQVSGVGGRFV